MRTHLTAISLFFIAILWSSCRNDLEYAPSAGNLEFSKDTVYLDTVFTNIGSSTYTLKVYNRTRDDVEIPTIRLAQGQNSSYRLNVDGAAGKEFENIPILAQDSIFIFVESTFDLAQTGKTEFLNTDIIRFDTGDNLQEVHLVTLVKDAVFLYPGTLTNGTKEKLHLGLDDQGNQITIQGFYLTDTELNFTNQKPYVIYGYAAVADGKQLIIDAGARVHFHKDSGIYVDAGGSLDINGELSTNQEVLEKEVILAGDRLNSELSEIPGQWGTIWISQGSIGNTLDYLTVKNATTGILVDGDGLLETPTLTIKNTQIYNSASTNLWSKNAFIVGENLVLGGAGNESLHCNLGGKYAFTHCTFANFWSNGFRTGAAVRIDNFSQTESADLIQADFSNCIIEGNTFYELNLARDQAKIFDYSFANCLIQFNDDNGQFENDPLYDFENTDIFNEVLFNEDANFLDTGMNDFRIGDPSAARDKANFTGANLVPFDLLGRDRTGSPDIGAYEVVTEN